MFLPPPLFEVVSLVVVSCVEVSRVALFSKDTSSEEGAALIED